MKWILIIFVFSFNIVSTQNLDDLYFGTDSTFDVVSWNIEWFPKMEVSLNYVELYLQI